MSTPATSEFAQMSVDLRVFSLLLGEARRRALTRVFGVPGDEQTLLVTLVLLGAVGTAAGAALHRPMPHLSARDAAIGGELVNASLRGLAGPPSAAMPAAGALIAFAVVGHALRPAVAGAIHDVEAAVRRVRAAFATRYRQAI